MFVDPCIIIKFVEKNPTRCNSVWKFIISYLYEAQHVSGDTPPIIRSLWFCIRGRLLDVWLLDAVRQSLGGVSLETCCASYKYEIKFWHTVASCWISYVNYVMMHGSTNIKFTNAKEAIEVYAYKNIKRKLYKTNATIWFNPLKPELNPIFYLLALLGAHHFLHVSRIRVNH